MVCRLNKFFVNTEQLDIHEWGEEEEDGEEKKEDDYEEEEMEGKRSDEEDIQDSLVVQEGMKVNFTLVPFATFAALASTFFPARRN